MEMPSLEAFLDDGSQNFGPNSWDEYNIRVKTFITDGSYQSYWLLKPISLSPAACARYGWKCIAKDMIQCTLCHETICAKLPKVWESNVYDRCVEEIKALLIRAHKPACPWPTAPCPESFVQMEVVSKKMAYKEFVSRLESLLKYNILLPQIKEEALNNMELKNNNIQSLCELSNIPYNDTNQSAVILALLGWKMKENAECKKFLSCSDCQRSVGLWLYVTTNTTDSCEAVDDESSLLICEKQKKEELFNPLYEHRHWCKWITPGLTISKGILGFRLFQNNVMKLIKLDENPHDDTGMCKWLDMDDVL